MRKFKVFISEVAQKELYELSKDMINSIKMHLGNLEDDPFRSRPNADIKRLHGPETPHLFRLRVGDYRIVYFVDKSEVRVTQIFHRNKGYRWME